MKTLKGYLRNPRMYPANNDKKALFTAQVAVLTVANELQLELLKQPLTGDKKLKFKDVNKKNDNNKKMVQVYVPLKAFDELANQINNMGLGDGDFVEVSGYDVPPTTTKDLEALSLGAPLTFKIEKVVLRQKAAAVSEVEATPAKKLDQRVANNYKERKEVTKDDVTKNLQDWLKIQDEDQER